MLAHLINTLLGSRSDSCCFVLVLCYLVDRMLCLAGKPSTKPDETHTKSHKTDHRSLLGRGDMNDVMWFDYRHGEDSQRQSWLGGCKETAQGDSHHWTSVHRWICRP